MDFDNPTREAVARAVVGAAERGDKLAFSSAAQRYGSMEDAQALVRDKAVMRMSDRVVACSRSLLLPETAVRSSDGQSSDGGNGDTLFGHFTVWDAWYEVDSYFEGHFMERTVRGSTKKTMQENRESMRALFQHGTDPIAADKPLGTLVDLREDDTGAYYEVALLRDDSGELVDYVRSIAPGIRDGLYGASFRFRSMREDWNDAPKASAYNPSGLPERSIKEMQVMEFGPVTFPASRAATASLRSQPIPTHELRMDTEDLSTLAQMISLGAAYIDEQDEPDDVKNVPVMEGVLATLATLVTVEAAEDEPADDEDPAGRSKQEPGRTLTDSTPPTEGTQAGSLRRPTVGTSTGKRRDPVYGMNRKEIPSWML